MNLYLIHAKKKPSICSAFLFIIFSIYSIISFRFIDVSFDLISTIYTPFERVEVFNLIWLALTSLANTNWPFVL